MVFDNKNENIIRVVNNKKDILRGEYSFYGVYQPQISIWVWASSIPATNHNHINKVLKIKQMSYLFENSNDKWGQFYYQFLSRDMLYIPQEDRNKYLDMINKLLIYLGDDAFAFVPKAFNGNYQSITIHKVKEILN